jgi:hypothetical protein
MGSEYLAAQSIIMQFAMYTILLPFSIGVAGMDTYDGLYLDSYPPHPPPLAFASIPYWPVFQTVELFA